MCMLISNQTNIVIATHYFTSPTPLQFRWTSYLSPWFADTIKSHALTFWFSFFLFLMVFLWAKCLILKMFPFVLFSEWKVQLMKMICNANYLRNKEDLMDTEICFTIVEFMCWNSPARSLWFAAVLPKMANALIQINISYCDKYA